MSESHTSNVVLPSDEELDAKCLELGLVMRRAPAYDISHPPITLQPSRIKGSVLKVLSERQELWNEAVDRTARNYTFLAEALRETAASDVEFTGRLVAMLHDIYIKEAKFQPLMLGIFRTDYMRAVQDPMLGDVQEKEETASEWKNVEINTISVSFAGLSPLVGKFHRYIEAYQDTICGTASKKEQHQQKQNPSSPLAGETHVAQSTSSDDIPWALTEAVAAWEAAVPHAAFTQQYNHNTKTSTQACPSSLQRIVLVVTQEGERNTGDQYKLLFNLLETHHIPSIRRTHTQLADSMKLVQFSGSPTPFAVVEDKYVAAVVYFRCGYMPYDFPTEATWQARADLERCNAIKCPSLPYHLLTFKKLQQLWCDVSGVLAPIAFAGDAHKANTLAEHFMKQYSLNAAESQEGAYDPEAIIKEAIANPDLFVLKPQLEGGGNLIAGGEMQSILRDTKKEDPLYQRIRKEYILMQKIVYPRKTGFMLRQGARYFFDKSLCSELGIFGTIMSDGSSTRFNRPGGYIVRTKPSDMEDGGVVAGVACLDSMHID